MDLRPLLHALAPPICAGCNAHAGAAEPLCGRCRRELRWLDPEPAVAAGLPVWAPVAYEGPARGVVRALKFGGARRAAPAMAAQIAVNAPSGWLAGGALVPVPLHPSRARKRGYNQAERVAAALAERTGLELRDCLERAGPRGTQVGRDRLQRLDGIAGTVRMVRGRGERSHCGGSRAPPPPPLQRAVLVDDVVTTGATLAACARVLVDNGVAEVVAVAYARTPGR
jgi:predicted amidophosphoribosyltransferase